MKLRTCGDLHFISAIKGGFVTKLRNVNSRGKPALVFKSLSDIYESEDASRVASHSTSENSHSTFKFKRVKTEGSCLPMVDRTLQEVEQETRNCVSHTDDYESDSDSKMTLKELKERRKMKKRKRSSPTNSNLKKVCGEGSQSGEDDCDLMETLNSLKSKLPKKKPKGRRKCTNRSVFNSELALSIKSEPISFSENSMEANWGLMSLIHVKTEDPEPEFLGYPNPIAVIEGLGFEDISDEISKTDEFHNRPVVFPGEQHLNDSLINVSCDSSGEDMEIDESDNFQLMLCSEDYQNCSLNEVSYNHLEHRVVFPGGQHLNDSLINVSCDSSGEDTEIDESDNIQLMLCSEDYQNCSLNEVSYDHLEHLEPLQENTEPDTEEDSNDQLSRESSTEVTSTAMDQSSSRQDDDFVLVKDNTTCRSSDAREDPLKSGNHSVSREDDSLVYGTQSLVPTITNSERNCSPGSQDSAGANASSDSVLLQTPERLPSRRKAISPTSQEQLRVAMKYDELDDDVDYYKCKEKLDFGKQTEIKSPTIGSRSPPASKAESSIQSRKLNRKKVMISPNQILKMSKNEKRGSPPKRNLDGPRISRSIPNFSTGCNSFKRCSESAITFSQRQMLDIESLADRLVNELKSMKDIVEQKLLFESYRNPSLKNDADEVKTAIKNATKVEETTRKLLSVMGRDCHRFCKIMRLTQNDPPASKNDVRRERKKISFADEAGGTLCHVKFFENGPTSPESPLTNQKDQIEVLDS